MDPAQLALLEVDATFEAEVLRYVRRERDSASSFGARSSSIVDYERRLRRSIMIELGFKLPPYDNVLINSPQWSSIDEPLGIFASSAPSGHWRSSTHRDGGFSGRFHADNTLGILATHLYL